MRSKALARSAFYAAGATFASKMLAFPGLPNGSIYFCLTTCFTEKNSA